MNSSRLEDFIGDWLPVEPDPECLRAMEIGADYIVSDNRREAVRASSTRTSC